MNGVPNAIDDRRLVHAGAASVQTYARIAGVLILLSIVAGGFGEFYVPSKLIVTGDAAATAKNIIAFDSLFRMGFASYLIEAVCDIALSLILYVLLRPVRKDIALLAAGLAAKPILDILAGYPEGAAVPPYISVLTGSDYLHREEQEIPGREFFRRGNPRAYHLHLTAIDSSFWRDHLTFRDCLRADEALRDAYAVLKCDLAARFPRDREAYIAAKASFVNDVLVLSAGSL